MNPLIVWLPSIAAATLLSTALVVMRDSEEEYARLVAAVPASAAVPTPVEAPVAAVQDAEMQPTAEEMKPEADEQKAIQDKDGSEMLAVMERQLKDAKRIVATMKSTSPTKASARMVATLDSKCGREQRALKDMGAGRVPDEVFDRAQAIKAEVSALSKEAYLMYKAYSQEKRATRTGALEAPAQPQQLQPEPALGPQPQPERENGDMADYGY